MIGPAFVSLLFLQQPTVDLTLKPAIGTTYRYAKVSTEEAEGRPEKKVTESSQSYKFVSQKDGVFDIEFTSTEPKKVKAAADLGQPLETKKSLCRVDSHGRLTFFDNPQLPGATPEMEGMSRGFGGFTLPEGPLTVGGKWSRVVEVGQVFAKDIASDLPPEAKIDAKGKLTINYVLVKLDDDKATLSGVASGSIIVHAQMPGVQATLEMTVELKGTQTTVLERSTGMELTTDSESTVSYKTPAGSGTGKTKVKSKRL